MILDRLERAGTYSGLGERLETALRFLKETDCQALPLGKTAIRGDEIFALVQEYTSKPRSEGVWEAHRRHIDVQYVVTGEEEMGYAPIGSLTTKQPYDETKDFELFNGPGSFVHVPQGSFTIFFPQDGHIPGLAANGSPSPVRKIVVKVAIP